MRPYFCVIFCSPRPAKDSDKDEAATSKPVKPSRGRPKVLIGAAPTPATAAKPRGQPTPTATSELVTLTASDESPSGKREMKYNADGLLVSVRDGHALASQLSLKKKYSNNYRNPDNKERCYA